MMMAIDIESLMHEYRQTIKDYSAAKARRTYIEEFRKSKFALLMKEADRQGFKTAAAQEREAYSSEEYIEFLDGLQAAVEAEERLRYDLRAIEMQAEVWRTHRADERFEKKAYASS